MEPRHLESYDAIKPSRLRNELSGKSVLVTGGGYGIGASIARSFAEAGVSEIILVGRNETKLKESAESLSSITQAPIRQFVVDISSKEDVKALFDNLERSPDVLINNAGFMASPANFFDADLEDYWKAFEINVFGTISVTQSYLKHRQASLGASSIPGVVITLNTIGAYAARVPKLSSYGATKAALARWSELIVQDVSETTARFISVHPGAIKTDMGTKSGLEGVFPATDVKLASDFVAWSASEAASFLNGRFVWVNWDVEELLSKRREIVDNDLLRTSLSMPP